MIIGTLISFILIFGLVSGYYIYHLNMNIRDKDRLIESKDGEISRLDGEISRLEYNINHYELLCDHRVGLMSKTITPPGYSIPRTFDIEVIIMDQCGDKSKIRILEVINTSGRYSNGENEVKKIMDGQWVNSNEISELSNSRLLTREKRMSKLLDN